ncbi:protein ENHANCED DISEASE RESISTANCE 4-like [Mercurialis annua]|uniref:protein ENHANCED DISEASE RESISTANCE 4-like n=1 Tax=Mercurialis annua TaxID=3986 RepID=UPI0021609DDC|nr:protein ENHANCED DISEASE RESISTANCE 4-like [Mercurialis annua]
MGDSTKVRLVRCPKCENLLPELADYSVYQCGGCGAVLRAKDRSRDADTVPREPDETQVAGVATELQSSEENGVVELSDSSDVDNKSNAGSLNCEEKNSEKNDTNDVATSSKCVVDNDVDGNLSVENLNNSVGSENNNLNSELKHKGRSWKSGEISGWERREKREMAGFQRVMSAEVARRERSEMEGVQRVMRAEVEGIRFSTSNYPDEGPSDYNQQSLYGYGESLRKHDDHVAASKVQQLEKDRVELLRKLDELKEQLSRSCDVADKPKERGRMAPSDPYTGSGSDPWFPGGSSMPGTASTQFFAADKYAARPPYFHHQPDLNPYTGGHEMPMHNFHPSMHNSNYIPDFADPFGIKRVPHPLSGQYPSGQYFNRHYFDSNSDPFEPYTSNANFHQPSCSCFQCYERHHGVPAPVPPAPFSNKRFPNVSNNPMMYHHENAGSFGSHVRNSRSTVPPQLHYRGPQSHSRWPSDLNPEMGAFVRSRPRRVVIGSGGRCCRPMAGGAPFFTCFNCFEVLQIPKKVLLMGKNRQKIRCGSCSTVINIAVVNEKLVFSVNAAVTLVPTEVFDSSMELIKDTSYSHCRTSRMHANYSSDDYDNSGYDFQTVDTDPLALSTGQALNSMKHLEMNGFHTSLSTSDDESSPSASIAPREAINSVQQPLKDSLSPPPPGSPLQHHFDYSSNNNAVNRFGKGNRSSRSDQEKLTTSKATTRQNSMKDASLATEIEVPFHEYANTGVSHDSGDANREDSQLKINKGSESFLANIIKKSFKDFSRSNQPDERSRINVSVNGHPIPDRLVKKAEKLAGPIQPGKYWYDFRAGFWGVIGGSCLGIIPPYIEEFNYPMPEDCAGGNTSIYVNGRELHTKDLDLLSGRGLPSERDRSYIIEISGRVLDEDTGEELDSLGRLAPTVEKVKHGFGMKVPKSAA